MLRPHLTECVSKCALDQSCILQCCTEGRGHVVEQAVLDPSQSEADAIQQVPRISAEPQLALAAEQPSAQSTESAAPPLPPPDSPPPPSPPGSPSSSSWPPEATPGGNAEQPWPDAMERETKTDLSSFTSRHPPGTDAWLEERDKWLERDSSRAANLDSSSHPPGSDAWLEERRKRAEHDAWLEEREKWRASSRTAAAQSGGEATQPGFLSDFLASVSNHPAHSDATATVAETLSPSQKSVQFDSSGPEVRKVPVDSVLRKEDNILKWGMSWKENQGGGQPIKDPRKLAGLKLGVPLRKSPTAAAGNAETEEIFVAALAAKPPALFTDIATGISEGSARIYNALSDFSAALVQADLPRVLREACNELKPSEQPSEDPSAVLGAEQLGKTSKSGDEPKDTSLATSTGSPGATSMSEGSARIYNALAGFSAAFGQADLARADAAARAGVQEASTHAEVV
eukprot:TRINITY_DN75731_c0_g1_i1.p1 TRINITY_DN75731_c0_g1~~TRINITY_DN75731_c0_g1_i1.p1  ORF type:complete len:485 (+),score=98.53 TRINITY_DN75731_c0_g1_i1:85-1455(+)